MKIKTLSRICLLDHLIIYIIIWEFCANFMEDKIKTTIKLLAAFRFTADIGIHPPPPKHTHPSDGYRYYPIEQIFTIRHNNNNNIYTYTIYNRSENVIYLQLGYVFIFTFIHQLNRIMWNTNTQRSDRANRLKILQRYCM